MSQESVPVSNPPGALAHGSAGASSLVDLVVSRVKPWKELITILVFFGGGAVWVGGYFATRKQVDRLECFAKESVALARAETAMRHTFDELVQKSMRIDQLEGKVKDNSASESDRFELKRLQREYKDLEERRKAATTKFDTAEKNLNDGLCAREK